MIEPDPWELIEEMAAQIELWSERAEHWRQVATDFAASERLPYPLPGMAARQLREFTPKRLDWGPKPPPSNQLVPTTPRKLRWWIRNDERPLGQTDQDLPSRVDKSL